jgi:hypothetical protein
MVWGLGGLLSLTHAKTVDDTANDHLWQMPRDDLEDGADSIADEAERDGLFAAELVAEGEGEDGAAEGAELTRKHVSGYVSDVWPAFTYREAARRNAGDTGLVRFGEVVLEVGRDQHA